MSNQLSAIEYQEKVNALIYSLKLTNEDNYFDEIECDLLAFAMPEFIASDKFIKFQGDRRKDFFAQYEVLKSILQEIQSFLNQTKDYLEIA